MIFNEGNVKLAVCFLVLCVACTEFKVHPGDLQDQTSSRPNTLFDDADDIQRQLDNEARDRFKYGRPKAIWILSIPTQIPLMTNSFDWVHRRPRNPVTSASWRNKFYTKSKPSKKNDVEPKTEYLIEPQLKYKNDAGPESSSDNFLIPEYNSKNNIELEHILDSVTKQGKDDNNGLGLTPEIKNSVEPESKQDDEVNIEDSNYDTGAEDINDLGLPPDVQNSMVPGSHVLDEIKQGPDNPDYETGIDIDNDLGPSSDVNNSMEPDVTVKQGPNNPFYIIGADNKINQGSPLDIPNAIKPGENVKSDMNKVLDKPDSTTGYTPTQSTFGSGNNLRPAQKLKNGIELGPDLKQGSDSLDSTTGAENKNNQGPPLDIKNSKKLVNSDLKQEPDISESTTQSAEINNNLGPPVDDKTAKEMEPAEKQVQDNPNDIKDAEVKNNLGPPLDDKNANEIDAGIKQGSDNQGNVKDVEMDNNLGPTPDDKNPKEIGPELPQGPDNPSDVKDGDVLVGSSSSWSYKEQDKWVTAFPQCGLYSQSPVNLPSKGLIGARGARPLTFINYDVMPLQLRLKNDGKTVTLSGDWEDGKRPVIYGGAGHSRRYRFHSLTLHAPSEHTIEKFLFPLETQLLHVSTDYETFEDAVNASGKDHLAFLGIVNIYKYGCRTESALKHILKVAAAASQSSDEVRVNNAPLSAFCPPFGEYACYHGSLSAPPCTEAVLWLIRGRALPLEREVASTVKMAAGNRMVQPLNDRRVILFNKK